MAFDKLAIVVVTYKRQELLATLFQSFLKLQSPVWKIIIVDNEHADETATMVADFAQRYDEQYSDEESHIVYYPQTENLGGSGGFSRGVQKAYELGAQWFWVMDDDVAVEPDALEQLGRWSSHDVIQGSRYDYDGGDFYWQYHFLISLGIPNPIAPARFGLAGYRTMNTMCFEGALFSRNIVQRIGFPDDRFFIYWDDTLYGYLASRVTNPIVIPEKVLRRTRNIDNWDIAGVRQLNSTSDMNRYYIMRNRGHMARYFMCYGDYRPVAFAFGTFLTFVKECIRLVAVDRSHIVSGVRKLISGWWASRSILHDKTWQPMSLLHPVPSDDSTNQD